jgi:hypothetical protein
MLENKKHLPDYRANGIEVEFFLLLKSDFFLF